MKEYDYLIVGAGLFGSIFAFEANKRGKRCLVIDKRAHVGGNLYCEEIEGIHVHRYGAHIFHTSNQKVWDYVQQSGKMFPFVNAPLANYKGELYNLPFNMNTFYALWGVKTPAEAQTKLDDQRKAYQYAEPKNLQEQALSLVGKDIYEKLIKGYTEKQWGRPCAELPAFIIKRLPLRFTFDNNYFSDIYQGIPEGGYNVWFDYWLKNVDVQLETDFFENRERLTLLADKIIYTGMIDQYYDYCFGELDYRSLRFESKVLDIDNFQGNAVVNYTDAETPFTRILEHKHFERGTQAKTVITYEYPQSWDRTKEAYYPVNDEQNEKLAQRYRHLAMHETNVHFGGRLADYRYYDMHHVIEKALDLVESEFKSNI